MIGLMRGPSSQLTGDRAALGRWPALPNKQGEKAIERKKFRVKPVSRVSSMIVAYIPQWIVDLEHVRQNLFSQAAFDHVCHSNRNTN